MKILMLNYEFPPIGGGAGNANFYLLKEFSRYSDLEIELITSSEGSAKNISFSKNIMVRKLDVKKKGHHHWRASELLSWSVQAFNMAKGKKFDLCHAWFGWPCGVIPYLQKKNYIVSLRGSDVPGFNPRLKLLDKTILPISSRKIWGKARCVVANSEGLKDMAERSWQGKIIVIPNGVDLEEFSPKKSITSSKTIKVVSVGRLIARKRFDILIRAVSKSKYLELTIIGDGELKDDLKSLARKLDSNVTFSEKLSHKDIPSELRKADIFVLPSESEGMSNAMLEAMASGLPIISGPIGGSKELLNGNGFIIDRFTSDMLEATMLRYKDKKLLLEQGNSSRRIAESYSWKNSAEAYHRIYEKFAR